jgi:hypothetical protein
MSTADARTPQPHKAGPSVRWGTVSSIAGPRTGTTSQSTSAAAANLRSTSSRVGKGRRD